MRVHWLRAGSAALIVAAAAAGLASAQTVLSPVPADPATLRLQERVEQIEQQTRSQTGEIERLRFDLEQARQEIARMNRLIDDLLAREGGAGELTPPAAAGPGLAAAPPAAAAPTPAAAAAPLDAPTRLVDQDAAFRNAQELLLASDYPGAERAFRAYLRDFGATPQAADARYWLGQTLLAQGANSEAAKQFLETVRNSPNSSRAPDAFVRLGVALKAMGNVKEACLTFKDLPRRYPNADKSVKDYAAREARAASCPA